MQEAQLMEDNQRLKRVSGVEFLCFLCFPTFSIDGKCLFQQMEKQFKIKIHAIEQGLSSESITNICSSSYPPQHQDNDDTCLKLG
jgi:hypothetical protein